MIKGRIHSVETMGTVDGPGIRYVLFMQGCPLRCVFCHNRDSWDKNAGTIVDADDIFNEIKEYLPFLKSSGGGITATGGEPLLQPDFLKELFIKVKKLGLNTALDTSGYANINMVNDLLDHTDLVILSIKHPDNSKHKTLTGSGNKKVFEFMDYLEKINKPTWIRYVVIPGLTDSEEDIKELINFLSPRKNIELVEILPYHTLGMYKWEDSGYDYPLKNIKSPSKESIEKIRNIISDNGFKVV